MNEFPLENTQIDLTALSKAFGQQEPYAAVSYNNLAIIFERQNKFLDAIDYLEKAKYFFMEINQIRHDIYGIICFELNRLTTQPQQAEQSQTVVASQHTIFVNSQSLVSTIQKEAISSSDSSSENNHYCGLKKVFLI